MKPNSSLQAGRLPTSNSDYWEKDIIYIITSSIIIYSIGSNFNGLTSIFRDMISGITVSTKVFLTSFETATAVTLAVLA